MKSLTLLVSLLVLSQVTVASATEMQLYGNEHALAGTGKPTNPSPNSTMQLYGNEHELQSKKPGGPAPASIIQLYGNEHEQTAKPKPPAATK